MTTNLKMIERIPLEILNKGDLGLVDEIYATDYVERTGLPGVPTTRDGVKQTVKALRTAFPDLHYTIDVAIESGDRFVHRVTGSGTMKGDLQGMPATGKRATWTEIHIGKVANGRLTEHWGLADQLGMLVQLGVVPAPGRVPVTV